MLYCIKSRFKKCKTLFDEVLLLCMNSANWYSIQHFIVWVSKKQHWPPHISNITWNSISECHWLISTGVCLHFSLAYRDGVVLLDPGSVRRLWELGVEVVTVLNVDDDVGAGRQRGWTMVLQAKFIFHTMLWALRKLFICLKVRDNLLNWQPITCGSFF